MMCINIETALKEAVHMGPAFTPAGLVYGDPFHPGRVVSRDRGCSNSSKVATMKFPTAIIIVGWPLACTAIASPLEVYEKLINLQSEWTVRGQREKAATGASELAPIAAFPELCVAHESTRAAIAQTLVCASYIPINGEESPCRLYEFLLDGAVAVRLDKTEKQIFIGYRYILGVKEAAGTNATRVAIFEQAMRIWPAIKEYLADEEKRDYQQFHVGYGTGGSFASLMGMRVLASKALPYGAAGSEKNLLRQVKVMSVQEISVFSPHFVWDPVGSDNHIILFPAHIIPANHGLSFGKRLAIAACTTESNAPDVSADQLAAFAPGHILTEENTEYFQRTLRHHQNVVKHCSDQIPPSIPSAASIMRGTEQTACMTDVQDILTNFLPSQVGSFECAAERLRESSTSSSENTAIDSENFTIICHVTTKTGERVELVKMLARLSDFDSRVRDCATMNSTMTKDSDRSKKHTTVIESSKTLSASGLRASKFRICLEDLTKNNPQWSLLFPDTNKSCKFVPLLRTEGWSRHGDGCLIRPIFNKKMLKKLVNEQPALFMNLMPKGTAFPESCKTIIESTPMSWEEQDQMTPHFKETLKFLETQVPSTSSTMVVYNRRVPLKNNFFKLLGQSHLPVDDGRAAARLAKCFSPNQQKVFFDCTKTINQWIPGVCPSFCAETASVMCSKIMYCKPIRGYVSLITEKFFFSPASLDTMITGIVSTDGTAPLHSAYAFRQENTTVQGLAYFVSAFFSSSEVIASESDVSDVSEHED